VLAELELLVHAGWVGFDLLANDTWCTYFRRMIVDAHWTQREVDWPVTRNAAGAMTRTGGREFGHQEVMSKLRVFLERHVRDSPT